MKKKFIKILFIVSSLFFLTNTFVSSSNVSLGDDTSIVFFYEDLVDFNWKKI